MSRLREVSWLLSGPPALSEDELGTIAVQLALTFPVWVRRRKTGFAFVDDKTIRQRQSMDFRLPAAEVFPAWARPLPGQQIYVPIWLGEKAALTKFSLMDENGGALVLLNAEESARFSARGLSAMVDGLSGTAGRGSIPPGSALGKLEEIARASAEDGRKLAEEALAPTNPLGRVLIHNDIFKAMVQDVGRQLLMLVPLTYRPESDRLIKWEHYVGHDWTHIYPTSRIIRPLVRLAVPVMTSIGLMDKRRDFRRLPVGLAQSTHFAFEPPPEARLTVARMDTTQWDPNAGRRVRVQKRRQVFDRPAIDLHTAPRVRRVSPGDPPVTKQQATIDLQAGRQDMARVMVKLRPATASVVVPSVVTSMATAGALWFALARLPELDGQTSAALLLLFPATAAAFLARAGDHIFSTRLLKGIRWSMAAVAACAVLAVGIIGGGLVHADLQAPQQVTTSCAVPGQAGAARQLPLRPAGSMSCTTVMPLATLGPVRSGARLTVRISAIVASVIAATMLIGMLLTRWRVWRRRHWGERENVTDVQPLP
jgi:hypothetical protein